MILMIIAGLIAAVSSYDPDCCTTYIHLEVTDTSSGMPSWLYECPKSCNITMDEFSICQDKSEFKSYNHRITTCSSKEFLFQSGIHHVHDIISFEDLDSIIIRGEPNATISCWYDQDGFNFISISHVTIKNMHIWNCRCKYTHYRSILYYYNETQYLEVRHLSLVIFNSNLNNSRLVCEGLDDISLGMEITIRDTIIQNSMRSYPLHSDSVFLDIDDVDLEMISKELNDNHNVCEFFNITIQMENVKFMNNSIPFIVSHHTSDNVAAELLCVFITFTGSINFYHNKGTIIRIPPVYIPPCLFDFKNHDCRQFSLNFTNEVLFSKAEVYITNNDIVLAKADYWYITDDDYVAPDSRSPFLIGSGDIIFEHCHVVFSGNRGTVSGGIMMQMGTRMMFNDNVTLEFSNNIGQFGGALFLNLSSMVVFNATINKSKIALTFKNNSAQRGGAIFVEDNCSDIKSVFDLRCGSELVTLTFLPNNLAQFGGNQIYGGWVDWFKGEGGMVKYDPNALREILNFERSGDSEVASCPFRICLCIDNRPDCNITNTTIEVYGYAVGLNLAAVGQRFTPVPGYVQANLTSQGSYIKRDELWRHWWPTSESVQATCKKIVYYRVYSNEETILFEPFLDGCNSNARNYSTSDSESDQALLLFQCLSIRLKYHDCPIGFILHKSDSRCICHSLLLSLGLSCDLQAIKIRRNKQQWLGVTHEHTTTLDNNPGVIVHPYCPFDYCRTDDESLLIQLEDETELCAYNRSGLLCGGCGVSFSRVLGSSKCKVCSTSLFNLSIIILGWLLSGLALVFLLMLLDLTVSAGTINGLTFYANIIQAQRDTFITPNFSSSLSYMFIAWLNLDQGIEICLYSSLDDYIVTWLRYFFPLYIWFIAAVLIITCHYSTYASKLLGRNAVQVLATLFLITYAKLLQLIIEVFSFTTLIYPDGYKKTVWLIDGNVEFLKGKHIPLFLVTVLFVLLSFPYTLILLTVQFLHKLSHYRVMFWVQRLKPFFDSYTGPYRDNHRYWTGLLLIIRIILLTSFSLNPGDKPTINLFIIILLTVTLLIWLYFTGFVYQSFLNNCLEAFFLFNLCLTSAAALFELSDGSHSPVVIYTSTGTAFMVFVGTIIYHALRRLFQSRVGPKLKKFVQAVFFKRSVNDDCSLLPNNPDINVEPSGEVSCTIVDLTQLVQDEDIEVKESL